MDLPANKQHPAQPAPDRRVRRPVIPSSEEEQMMLVSPDFDILMLHPAFERIWQRPASTFLGKKCYREIEKRDEPCPYCPGQVAMRTGAAASAEVCATLDDGTRMPFLLHAYPIYGSEGKPAGFVEKCENIAGRRRLVEDAQSYADLAAALLQTSSTSRVLTLALAAALGFDGAVCGCAVTVDPVTGSRELVAVQGFPSEELDALPALAGTAMLEVPEESTVLVRLPIACSSRPAAELTLRFYLDGDGWPGSRPKLEAVGHLTASALVRIRAERLRGDAAVDVERIFEAVPLPALFVDGQGRVTGWNQAAERAFGRKRREALGKPPLFLDAAEQERLAGLLAAAGEAATKAGFSLRCLDADGLEDRLSFRCIPVHDVLGDGTRHLLVAESPAASAPASPVGPRG